MRSRGLCSLIQMKGKKGRQADQTQRDRIRHPCCTGHCREKNVRRLPERRPGAGNEGILDFFLHHTYCLFRTVSSAEN